MLTQVNHAVIFDLFTDPPDAALQESPYLPVSCYHFPRIFLDFLPPLFLKGSFFDAAFCMVFLLPSFSSLLRRVASFLPLMPSTLSIWCLLLSTGSSCSCRTCQTLHSWDRPLLGSCKLHDQQRQWELCGHRLLRGKAVSFVVCEDLHFHLQVLFPALAPHLHSYQCCQKFKSLKDSGVRFICLQKSHPPGKPVVACSRNWKSGHPPPRSFFYQL